MYGSFSSLSDSTNKKFPENLLHNLKKSKYVSSYTDAHATNSMLDKLIFLKVKM